jgi:predicted metal-dependent peptidase
MYGLNTMAVDQFGNLMYYPPWVLAQTDTVMKCGIAHEVMHVVLMHLKRLGTRDQHIWNIAVDAAVNEVLSKTFQIPDAWVRIQKMAGKASEEIYDWILRNASTYKCPASGGFDSHIFGKDNGDSSGDKDGKEQSPFYQKGQTPVDVARAVKEAYDFAKQQGKLPAGIDRMFADILNPILDWKDILRKYIV